MAVAPSIGRASAVESPPAAPEADLTRALYERYSGQIYGFCLHKLGSREEAEDAVQNTFLNAFRGLRRGVVPQAESAWLFKIAENVCLSRHRSSYRRGRVESPSDLQAMQDVIPSPERRGDDLIGLQDALERMPESQRRAILLREWQGLSYREISAEMDLSQAAVETLIFRARRTLAQGLEEEPRTRGWKRLRQGADVGSILALLKTIFAGGAAVKAVATAVAVGTAVVVASSGQIVHHRASHPKPAGTPIAPSTSAPSGATSSSDSAPPRAVRRHGKPSAPGVPPGSTVGSIRSIPGDGTAADANPADPAVPAAPPVTAPPAPPAASPTPQAEPPRPADLPQPPPAAPAPRDPTPPAAAPQAGVGTKDADPSTQPAEPKDPGSNDPGPRGNGAPGKPGAGPPKAAPAPPVIAPADGAPGQGKGSDNKGPDPKGSDNKGSDPKGSDPKGSDPKGSDNKGSDNKGPDNKGSENKGSENKGSDNKGSDNKGQSGDHPKGK